MIEEIPLKNIIYAYLSEYHIGSENAVHCKVLAEALNVGTRKVQKSIKELRQNLVPVCSDNNGYFIAGTSADIHKTMKRLKRLSSNIVDTYEYMLCMLYLERRCND